MNDLECIRDHEIFICAPSSVPWAAGLIAAGRVWQTETAMPAPGQLQAIKGVGLWAARAGVVEQLLPPGQQDRASAQALAAELTQDT